MSKKRDGFCKLYCDKCGCGKGASDKRLERGDIDKSRKNINLPDVDNRGSQHEENKNDD